MAFDTPSNGVVSRLLRLFISREFSRYLLIGGLCAAVNFAIGLAVRAAFGEGAHALSVLVGFLVGTVVSFFLNKYYTFHAHSESMSAQAIKYALAAFFGMAFAIGAGELLLVLGRRVCGGARSEHTLGSITHIMSIGLATVLNFLTVKFFALRTPKSEGP